MTLFDAPEQLRCLQRHLRLVNLTESNAICDNEQWKVPCLASGCTKAHTTIKLTIAVKEKLTKDG